MARHLVRLDLDDVRRDDVVYCSVLQRFVAIYPERLGAPPDGPRRAGDIVAVTALGVAKGRVRLGGGRGRIRDVPRSPCPPRSGGRPALVRPARPADPQRHRRNRPDLGAGRAADLAIRPRAADRLLRGGGAGRRRRSSSGRAGDGRGRVSAWACSPGGWRRRWRRRSGCPARATPSSGRSLAHPGRPGRRRSCGPAAARSPSLASWLGAVPLLVIHIDDPARPLRRVESRGWPPSLMIPVVLVAAALVPLAGQVAGTQAARRVMDRLPDLDRPIRSARLSLECRGPADPVVGEAQRGHPRGVVDVAAVEDDRLAHQAAHDLEVGVAELVPLGDDGQGVGLLEGAVGAVAVGQPVAVDRADVGQRLGVVDAELRRRRRAARRSAPAPGPRGCRRSAA